MLYRYIGTKHRVNGVLIAPGTEVELSASQFARLRDKFEVIEYASVTSLVKTEPEVEASVEEIVEAEVVAEPYDGRLRVEDKPLVEEAAPPVDPEVAEVFAAEVTVQEQVERALSSRRRK